MSSTTSKRVRLTLTEEETIKLEKEAIEKYVKETLKNPPPRTGVIDYFSRSKNPVARYLSNFCVILGNLEIENDEKFPVDFSSVKFSSVEHAFHYCKLFYLDSKKTSIEPAELKATKKKFTANGEFNQDAQKANGMVLSTIKSKGGKKFFKDNKMVLDIVKWNQDRVPIMRKLLRARYEQDPQFQEIIKECASANIQLKHFGVRGEHFWDTYIPATGPKKGEWVGDNTHGKLLMELYDPEKTKE